MSFVDPSAKKPKKPEPTLASLDQLVAHYNLQLEAYNSVVRELSAGMRPERVPENLKPMEPVANGSNLGCEYFIEAIRRQNRRLGRTVRRRALELLEARVKGLDGRPMTDADGRSIGLKYKEVLDIIHSEFPEASTSVACLRWYVVHLRMEANDLGIPWPDMPQIRPRAKAKAVE